jgi:hypothetical protein
MNRASDLLNIANLSVAKEKQENRFLLDSRAVQLVDYVFAQFSLHCRGYDSFFKDKTRLRAEKTVWYRSFTTNNIFLLSQVKFGLKKLDSYAYPNPPQLGEFKKWCCPTLEELGIPSIDYAYSEACKNSYPYEDKKTWSHPIVYHAWSMTGSHELNTLSKASSFPIFSRNYDIASRMIMNGEGLKDIPKALTSNAKEAKPEIDDFYKPMNSIDSAMSFMKSILKK